MAARCGGVQCRQASLRVSVAKEGAQTQALVRLTPASLRAFGGEPAPGLAEHAASGISFHSGRLKTGEAFFALPGEQMHGLAFAEDALAKGAAFIISDKPHPQGVVVPDPAGLLLELGQLARRERSGAVTGITGSVGKTSAKTFAAAALAADKSPGNFNTPLALAKVFINTALAKRAERALVLELGIDHVGEMDNLTRLTEPDYGLLTHVGASHLEQLETVATVAFEKSRLLVAAKRRAFVSEQALGEFKKNLDIDLSALKAKGLTSYGFSEAAQARGHFEDGVLHYKDVSLRPPAQGRAMALNALGALVLAEALGVPLGEAAKRVEEAKLEPGRLQTLDLGGLTVLNDSYNSNPSSAAEALEILLALPGPHTAVLGDMLELGQESARYHFELGVKSRAAERVIAIGQGAKQIALANSKARYFASTELAVPALRGLPLAGTVLLKASRGMHFERLLDALQQAAEGAA